MRALVMSICIAVTATPALADEKADKEKAKQLFEEGLRRYNLADYAEAIKAWKESYLLSKAPLLLFSIGQAHRQSGDCGQAMRFYENYKREAPNPKNKAELDDAIKLCAGKTEPVRTEPVKTEPVKTEPVKTEPVKTEPVKTEPVKTEPVKTEPVKTEPVKEEGEEPPPAPAPPGRTKRGAGLAVLGVGAISGGVGLYFAVQSGKASKELNGYEGAWGSDEVELERKGLRQEKIAIALGAVGAAAMITGGVIYYLGRRDLKTWQEQGGTIGLVPTSDGLEVAFSTRF